MRPPADEGAVMSEKPVIDARPRLFHTLDALRGVAALLIVTRHSDRLFGGLDLPESWLAVDLFFVMSGVVIAHSYEERLLNGASPLKFILLRVIRLYPLYLIGITAGFVQYIGHEYQKGGASHAWVATAMQALFLALLMAPSFNLPALDGPRWSLFFEMVANIAYGLFARAMTTARLCGLVALSAVGLAYVALVRHDLSGGYQADLLYVGLLRVSYSFFLGVLILRLWKPRVRHAPLPAWLCVAAVCLTLAVTIPAPWQAAYELAMVLVGFPLIVACAMRFDVGGATNRIFSFLGVTSYAIYILHHPCALLFQAVLHRVTGRSADALSPYGGILFIILLIGACWFLDKAYDQPVRIWLRARLGSIGGQRPRLSRTVEGVMPS